MKGAGPEHDYSSATGALTTVDTEIVHGGYTAAGIGMRNLGSGTISIDGVPAGAKVKSATLLWDVLADASDPSFAQGTFNGEPIAGNLWASGASPCWPVAANWSYEADVTSLVTGNGSYSLADFASGDTNGQDPWNVGSDAPLLEGASLVVIYQKASMPHVVVQIAEGASETGGDEVDATLSGFSVDSQATAQTTYIVADGQESGNTGAFNGTILPGVGFPGADPQAVPNYSQGNLWDTVTANVDSLVSPGDTSESMAVTGGGNGDCLVWVGQVLQVAGTGFIPIPQDAWRSYTLPSSPLPGWDPINMVILREGYTVDAASITDESLASALSDNNAPWFTTGIGSGIGDAVRGRCVSQQNAAVQSGDPTRSKQDFSWRRVSPEICLNPKLIEDVTTNHVRGYIQKATGAWFLAVSQEQFCKIKDGDDKRGWHCITPDGYNEGRLQLADDLENLPGYSVDVTYVHEYPAGSPPFADKDPLGHPKFNDLVAVVTIEKKS